MLIGSKELWRGILSHMYGNLKYVVLNNAGLRVSKRNSLWRRDLASIGSNMEGNSNWFVDNLSYKLGYGKIISFLV